MELKNTFSAVTKNDGIKPGPPQNVCFVGYNSVRGFEENDKKERNRGEAAPRSKNEGAVR